MKWSSALWAVSLSACMPALEVPSAADIRCQSNDDCPADLLCVDAVGRCAAPGAPCIDDDGAALPDGASCGEGTLCVGARCVEAGCGDGYRSEREQCDPVVDFICRNDCTFPYCGDDVVDLGESCEGGANDCDQCTLVCSVGRASCDLMPSNGCECTASPYYTFGDGEFVALAARQADELFLAVFHENAGDLWEIWRLSLGDDTLEPIVTGKQITTVAANRTRAVLGWFDGERSTIARYDNGAVVPFFESSDFIVQELAADDTRVFVAIGGIYAGDIETGEVIGELSPVCGDALRLLVCGETLLCLENETEDTYAIDTTTGAAEVIANGPFRFGCSADGEVLWHDFRRVGVGTGADARVVALLPLPSADLSFPLEQVFSLGDDVLLSMVMPTFAGTFLAESETRAVAAIQWGFVLDASEHGIISFDIGDDAIVKLDVP